jgi:hypothetical protein
MGPWVHTILVHPGLTGPLVIIGCPCTDIVAKVEHFLGGKLDATPSIHVVRDVAPGKLMLCVSFRIPESVAFSGRRVELATSRDKASWEEAGDRHEGKRQKTV